MYVHKVRHVRKELTVSVKVTLVHQTAIAKHSSENRVLIDRTILDASLSLPNDLLMLAETLIQEMDLQGERVASHVLVERIHVRVRHVNHVFIVNG